MRTALWLATACIIAPFASQAGTAAKIGDTVGTVHLVTPGNLHVNMDNYAERRGTAVLFLSTRDEGTETNAESIRGLNRKFRRRKILFVGVFPNADEPATEVRAYAQAHGFNFPVCKDPGMEAAKRLGARVTPELFLINKEGQLVYDGSIASAADALTAFEAGNTLPAPEASVEGTPIGKQLPPRKIEDPYGSIEYSSELIFETIPGYPVHHCSSITEAPNGDLLVSWYGGSYESSDDQVLFLARRPKGSRVWSVPEIIVRSPGKPPGNALLFTDKT